MKALYFTGDKQTELREIDKPSPRQGEYLIRVEACGICGSDFEGYLGKTGRRTPPMIMGHEFSGVIESSTDAMMYPKGTKVTVYPKQFCGKCEKCQIGLTNICENGPYFGVFNCDGAMTEYICVGERFVVPYDPALSPTVATLVEPLAVAYSAASKVREKISESDYIAVIGAGTIGLLVVAVLKYLGAKHIIVSDTYDKRLEIAKELGADECINPLKSDFIDEIQRITKGKKCDLVFEAVGLSVSAASSLEALHSSGTAVWIGNAQKIIEVDMQKIVTTELSIIGTYAFSFDCFKECAKLLSGGAFDIEKIITDVFPLESGVEAFRRLENNADGSAVKVVIT